MTGVGNPETAACDTNVGFSSDYDIYNKFESTVPYIQQIKATTDGITFWIKFTLSNTEVFWINEAYGDTKTESNNKEETWDFTEDKPFIGLFGFKTELTMSAFGPLRMERTLCKASEIEFHGEKKYDNVAWNE